jgi:hypothetical protein
MHIFHNTNFDFLRGAGTRSRCRGSSSSPAWRDRHARDSEGHRVRRRHAVIVEFDRRRPSMRAQRAQPQLPGGGEDAIVQSYGDPSRGR